jgi:hypothetical protein
MNFLKRLFGGGGLENVSSQILQKDERPKPSKCILCGGLLRQATPGQSLHCASGHKALFWMGDNKWFTKSDDVAQQLRAKGIKVMSTVVTRAEMGPRHFIET